MTETTWGESRQGPRRRFGKAGRPLTRSDERTVALAAGKARQEALQLNLAAARAERAARQRWEAGKVVPDYITTALDMASLYGPEVDQACGVEEPAVDEWEAGTRYPTWEQLQALAKLTDTTPTFFVRPLPRITNERTTLDFHLSLRELRSLRSSPTILGFTDDALRAALGRVPGDLSRG